MNLSPDEHAIIVAFRATDPALRDFLRSTIVRGVRLVATVNRDTASRRLRDVRTALKAANEAHRTEAAADGTAPAAYKLKGGRQ